MKQILKSLSRLAGIAFLLTLATSVQAAPIDIAYEGMFNEKTDSPAGDFDSIVSPGDIAVFELLASPVGFRNVFEGSLNLSDDPVDSINIRIGPDQILRSMGFVYFDGEFTVGRTTQFYPPYGQGLYLYEVSEDYFDSEWEGDIDYTLSFTVETSQISVVPLPAALPLYGAGIALLGFISWQRKRKQA
ncbi:MAG: hypothetical protein MI743_01215 [Sneathiellales bacterium]|nr:hypothetical protein [Sneathiellales bacterium]